MLSAGDYLSVQATNGVHHLHQTLDDVGADAGGATPEVAVVPSISPSIGVGDAVTLVDPVMAAVIDPATLREGRMSLRGHEGIAFDAIQTLRP